MQEENFFTKGKLINKTPTDLTPSLPPPPSLVIRVKALCQSVELHFSRKENILFSFKKNLIDIFRNGEFVNDIEYRYVSLISNIFVCQ